MAALTKEDILGASDLDRVEVEVPEWGGSVWIRPLTVAERAKTENAVKNESTGNDLFALTVSMAAVDEDGKQLFNKNDLHKLKEKNGAVVQRLYQKAVEINKVNEGND